MRCISGERWHPLLLSFFQIYSSGVVWCGSGTDCGLGVQAVRTEAFSDHPSEYCHLSCGNCDM